MIKHLDLKSERESVEMIFSSQNKFKIHGKNYGKNYGKNKKY